MVVLVVALIIVGVASPQDLEGPVKRFLSPYFDCCQSSSEVSGEEVRLSWFLFALLSPDSVREGAKVDVGRDERLFRSAKVDAQGFLRSRGNGSGECVCVCVCVCE